MYTKLLNHGENYVLVLGTGEMSIVSAHGARDFLLNFTEAKYNKRQCVGLESFLQNNLPGQVVAEIDSTGALVVRSADLFRDIINKSETEFRTITEFAAKYGWSVARVRRMCQNNELPDVVQKGKTYLIPSYVSIPPKQKKNGN